MNNDTENLKWLFEFIDGSFPYYTEAVNLKCAVIQLAEYTGNNEPLFIKSLAAMETDREVVELYNRFSPCSEIETVYQISGVRYSRNRNGGESDGS